LHPYFIRYRTGNKNLDRMQLVLFGQLEIPQQVLQKQPLQKTGEMMEEDLFWAIVRKSLKYKGNQTRQRRYLIKILRKLTPTQIIGFHLRRDKLLYDSYTSEMWCAAYIMNGGCSDSWFEFFRDWVISRGKRVFYKALKNPDSLVALVENGREDYVFGGFWYVALDAFARKTRKDLYDYIDYDLFKTRGVSYRPIQDTWDANNPQSMQAICPQLFALLWGLEEEE